jgi:tetratricopeptide (TPR) repeat protein
MNKEDKHSELLIRLANSNESERGWILMEFNLQNLSETLRKAVQVASIPHWFDYDFINYLLSEVDFKKLTELSFVEKYPERGFNIHEKSRKLLLDNLWNTDKEFYKSISRKAVNYCKHYSNEDVYWTSEFIYHEILAEDDNATDDFKKQSWAWYKSYQCEKLEVLLFFMMELVNENRVSEKTVVWIYYFKIWTDIFYMRLDKIKSSVAQIINKSPPDEFSKAVYLHLFGEARRVADKYTLARLYFKKSLNILMSIEEDTKRINIMKIMCLEGLGNCYRFTNQCDLALPYYTEAIILYEIHNKNSLDEALLNIRLADLYCRIGNPIMARDCRQKALQLYELNNDSVGKVNCDALLGVIYLTESKYELAKELLERTSKYYEKIGIKRIAIYVLEHLKSCYLKLGEYEKEKHTQKTIDNLR